MKPDSSDSNLPANSLYDEFQTLVQSKRADVAGWIESAVPEEQTLAEKLKGLDTLKRWLDSFRPLPDTVVEELRKYYTVTLTYNSNAIEGNTLSQSETELVLSQGITIGGKSLVEHLEVIGHRDAMKYVEELANDSSALTQREIKDLHSLIMSPVDITTGRNEAGAYRSMDVRASGTNYVYPPHYQIQQLMAEFAQWMDSPDARRLHTAIYASEVHFRFVSIHPFRDGNGRTARLLMNLCLLRAGYPITVITNARRAQYIVALVYGQNHPLPENAYGDASRLHSMVAHECRESFIEYLRLLATAGESRGHGELFYRELLANLKT